MTHEAGHFLGLDHTKDQRAIMRIALDPGDEQTYLGEDDIAGICAIYPPRRKAPLCDYEPRGGFSPACVDGGLRGGPACSLTPGPVEAGASLWALVASGLGLSLRLRRRRSRTGQDVR
jgi:MYXO-CTERM domain-containing protein